MLHFKKIERCYTLNLWSHFFSFKFLLSTFRNHLDLLKIKHEIMLIILVNWKQLRTGRTGTLFIITKNYHWDARSALCTSAVLVESSAGAALGVALLRWRCRDGAALSGGQTRRRSPVTVHLLFSSVNSQSAVLAVSQQLRCDVSRHT